MEAVHGANLDKVLIERGMTVTPQTRENLLLAAHRAGRQAAGVIVRQATGDYSPDLGAARFPALPDAKPPSGKGEFEAVWTAWAKEALPSENTIKRWRPVLDRMLTFAGTTDLGAISEDTLRDWLDSLLGELGNNTVGKVHLAAAKCMFKFARSTKRILVAAHLLSSRLGTLSAFATFHSSRLNPAPHTTPVYDSDPALPRCPQHAVPACPLRLWPDRTHTDRHSSALHDVLSCCGLLGSPRVRATPVCGIDLRRDRHATHHPVALTPRFHDSWHSSYRGGADAMSSLLTNTSAMSALASLTATQRQLSTTQAQVSSGLAIANASDNAAYWSIATTMRSEVAGLSAVQQSLSMTGALMSVTSTAIGQIIGLVQGIGADLVTAQEAGVDRRSVQSDIAARQASLNATLASAAFNGVNLLVGSSTSQSTNRSDYFDTTKASFDAGFSGDVYHTVHISVDGVLITQDINYVHSTGPGTYADTTAPQPYGSGMLGAHGPSRSGVLTFPTGFGGAARTSSVDLTTLAMTATDTTSSSDVINFQNPSGGTIAYSAGAGTAVTGSGMLDRSLSTSDANNYSVLTLDVSQISDAALGGLQGSISSVLADLQSAADRVGAVQTQVSTMQSFNASLSDALTSGIGSLVDADMNVASTRLQALQTQQQLGIQALSMANQNSSLILKLFQAA